jgi:hypothetical protein
VTKDEIVAALEKSLAGWKAADVSIPAVPDVEGPAASCNYVYMDINQAYISLGFQYAGKDYLINLIDVKEFFGSANLSAGMYTQIRLTVESCVITVNGTEYNCTVPSGAMCIRTRFRKNSTCPMKTRNVSRRGSLLKR